jgi:hypothetical protein
VEGATYLTDNKYKGGSVLAFLESPNQDYIEVTVRFKGSLAWTPHEVWLCNPGTITLHQQETLETRDLDSNDDCGDHQDGECYDAAHFDDCVQMVDGFQGSCEEWPNTIDTNRAGNGATYFEWTGPWKFSSTFQNDTNGGTCDSGLIGIPCDPINQSESILCGEGDLSETIIAGCTCEPNGYPIQESPVVLFDPSTFSKVIAISVPDNSGHGHVAILANNPKEDPLFGDKVVAFCFNDDDERTSCD